MSDTTVSHIIPCLNFHDMTYKCLDFLEKNTKQYTHEVIIVDDGSTEPFINRHSSVTTVIRHTHNMGFPRSVNDGIKISHGKYIAVWNNDLFVAPNWLPPLIQALETTPYLGMAGPLLREPCHMTEEKFFELFTEEWSLNQKPDVAVWHKGCPWVFKRFVVEHVGLFDEQFYPTQYEDSDYLLRMALYGYTHATVANSAAYHYSAFTQKNVLKEKFNGFNYANKNRERFEAKWGTFNISFENAFTKGVISAED